MMRNSTRSAIIRAAFIVLFVGGCGIAVYRSGVISQSREAFPVEERIQWTHLEFPEAAGEAAARVDLQRGVKKVVLYGLIVGTEPINTTLESFGYIWRPGGCIVGGNEYQYWNAYNKVMIEAGRKQFGDKFVAALQGTLL